MKLVVKNVSKSYSGNKVLDTVNFEFEKGKIYGLIGRNGAGKTTLFNLINKDTTFDRGIIYLEDKEAKEITKEDIGFVRENPEVPEFLTVKEFFKFYLDINKNKIELSPKVEDYLDFLLIEDKDRNKILKEVSHGTKAKVNMLINILGNPKVLLLDEPITSLDVIIADEVKKLLKSIKKDHIIILSTHLLDLATDLCDEIVLLNESKLTLMPQNKLTDTNFKDKIIEALTEDNDD